MVGQLPQLCGMICHIMVCDSVSLVKATLYKEQGLWDSLVSRVLNRMKNNNKLQVCGENYKN